MNTVEVSTHVFVSFLIPGADSVEERYDLGNAMDLVTWGLNEKYTAAVQRRVHVAAAKMVHPGLLRHMLRSRAGMRPYIQRKIAEFSARKRGSA